MKKFVLGGVLALLATAGAVYAYRTVHAGAAQGDSSGCFICPFTGKAICHGGTCTSEAKAEKAEHPSCCKKAAQASP